MNIETLPLCLVYRIMQYVPCLAITPAVLCRRKRHLYALRVLKRIMWMYFDEKEAVKENMETYDFYRFPIYIFESKSIMVTLQSEPPPPLLGYDTQLRKADFEYSVFYF